MKKGRLQCKDIPELPILRFLADQVLNTTHFAVTPVPGWPYCTPTLRSVPECADLPEKVLRRKLGAMARKGIITGCDCGCRGDWRITSCGLLVLKAKDNACNAPDSF